MITRNSLGTYLNDLLQVSQFKDYCPNGLQVEGTGNIKKIVTGVTASQALIDASIKENADALLVHHGYLWKDEDPRITGIKQSRIKALLQNDINLFAYHLPLDGHEGLGNNILLAKELGIEVTGQLDQVSKIGNIGKLSKPISGEDFAEIINAKLSRKPFYIAGSSDKIETIAWCTGGAQYMIDLAVEKQVDAYLTGEVSEKTVHIARETGIHFYAAGHHATERYGICALGEHIAKKFNIEHKFIDIDNPI